MPDPKTTDPTAVLIERIRQEIGCGRVPTADVLRLCDRAESLLSVSLRMETALHGAIKRIESY